MGFTWHAERTDVLPLRCVSGTGERTRGGARESRWTSRGRGGGWCRDESTEEEMEPTPWRTESKCDKIMENCARKYAMAFYLRGWISPVSEKFNNATVLVIVFAYMFTFVVYVYCCRLFVLFSHRGFFFRSLFVSFYLSVVIRFVLRFVLFLWFCFCLRQKDRFRLCSIYVSEFILYGFGFRVLNKNDIDSVDE